MALPQQVLERLSREPPQTPGWSFGILFFSGGLLFVALFIYFGLTLGYEPYIQGQIAGVTTQISTVAQSISPQDQAQLVKFYSEISNLNRALQNHVTLTPFFAWLEKNTEGNVYYTNLAFSGGNRIALSAKAPTEADVNQEISILEHAPEVQSATISNITLDSQTNQWSFSISLIMSSLAPAAQ